MESYLSLQGIAGIIAFLLPGYFAIKTYSLVNSKSERDFSALLLESAVFSVPIASFYGYIFESITGKRVVSTDPLHVITLILVSILVGYTAAKIRNLKYVQKIANRFSLPDADEDFLQRCFKLLDKNEPVAITLADNDVFSGTPRSGNVFKSGYPRQYYFDNIAWYNKATKKWDEHPGSLILDLSQVKYIETAKTLETEGKNNGIIPKKTASRI